LAQRPHARGGSGSSSSSSGTPTTSLARSTAAAGSASLRISDAFVSTPSLAGCQYRRAGLDAATSERDDRDSDDDRKECVEETVADPRRDL